MLQKTYTARIDRLFHTQESCISKTTVYHWVGKQWLTETKATVFIVQGELFAPQGEQKLQYGPKTGKKRVIEGRGEKERINDSQTDYTN